MSQRHIQTGIIGFHLRTASMVTNEEDCPLSRSTACLREGYPQGSVVKSIQFRLRLWDLPGRNAWRDIVNRCDGRARPGSSNRIISHSAHDTVRADALAQSGTRLVAKPVVEGCMNAGGLRAHVTDTAPPVVDPADTTMLCNPNAPCVTGGVKRSGHSAQAFFVAYPLLLNRPGERRPPLYPAGFHPVESFSSDGRSADRGRLRSRRSGCIRRPQTWRLSKRSARRCERCRGFNRDVPGFCCLR